MVEAFSLAGHQSFGISAFDANNFDWYDFALDAPTQIWFATLAVPADQVLRVQLFDGGGMVVTDEVPPVGETAQIGPTSCSRGRTI